MNIQAETVISIREIPAFCEEQLGRKIHPSTVHRWRQRGARGVRLETFLAGGRRYSSVEALQRFFSGTTAAADPRSLAPELTFGDSANQTEQYLTREGL